jgi:hypothetical protein
MKLWLFCRWQTVCNLKVVLYQMICKFVWKRMNCCSNTSIFLSPLCWLHMSVWIYSSDFSVVISINLWIVFQMWLFWFWVKRLTVLRFLLFSSISPGKCVDTIVNWLSPRPPTYLVIVWTTNSFSQDIITFPIPMGIALVYCSRTFEYLTVWNASNEW